LVREVFFWVWIEDVAAVKNFITDRILAGMLSALVGK